MVLNLVYTSIGGVSRHEETKAPFVPSTRILLVESWSNKRLENQPTSKVDAELELVMSTAK